MHRIRNKFEPPQEVGELSSDMPFADYLFQWLDIVRGRVKPTTYSSYEAKEVKAAQELNKQVCGNCYNYEYDGYVFVDELGNLMRPDHLTS